jgi:phosphoglycolate phosphatase-like HAD superfamily hydrolase
MKFVDLSHQISNNMSTYPSDPDVSIITEKEISALANHFSDLTVENVIAAPYVRGALEFIKKSYDQYKLFISTGTPTEEMKKILAGRKIANYFTDVFGSPAKKTVHVSNILNNYNLDPNELIFYGDSKTDLDAAKHANISFVLIKNKYNQTLSVSFRGKIINNFIGIL